MYFLALLMQYLQNYWTDIHQTFSIDAFWYKGECLYVWGQKVKGQGHSMTKRPAGKDIQDSTLCIEFQFLVVCSIILAGSVLLVCTGRSC